MGFFLPLRLLGVLIAGIALTTSCTLNDTSAGGTYFHLEGSPQLTTYERVTIVFGDTLGHVQDTLYDDSLPSLSRLNRLPVTGYQGGTVLIAIHGYRKGVLAYSESRLYDGRTQKVIALNINKPDSIVQINEPIPSVVSTFQKPTLSAFPHDTTVSIRDSVLLSSEAMDADGDLFAYAWVCSGGTGSVDSATIQGSRQKILYGKRFAQPGNYTCTLRIYDRGGRRCESAISIHVELDTPKADAGKDTTVLAGTRVNLHGMGSDGYGPIYAVAWKIGEGDFVPVTKWELSTIAPNLPGDLKCVLRVMDTDSLITLDTVVVTVILK